MPRVDMADIVAICLEVLQIGHDKSKQQMHTLARLTIDELMRRGMSLRQISRAVKRSPKYLASVRSDTATCSQETFYSLVDVLMRKPCRSS